jgi:hypothetical protein
VLVKVLHDVHKTHGLILIMLLKFKNGAIGNQVGTKSFGLEKLARPVGNPIHFEKPHQALGLFRLVRATFNHVEGMLQKPNQVVGKFDDLDILGIK